ncbi:MAG: hypothetical protein ACPGO5_02450 [Patescibacteria group bacterium]
MERRRRSPEKKDDSYDESRRKFLKKLGFGLAGAAMMPSDLFKDSNPEHTRKGYVEVGESGPVPSEYEDTVEKAELLTEGVMWPKVEAYIRENAFMHPDSAKNIVSEVVEDTDPRSDTNLMARMMFSEDSKHPVVAALIGYVAYNRMNNARNNRFSYSLQDVICGYGKDAFGEQDGSRPFASNQEVIDDVAGDNTVLESTQVDSRDFFKDGNGDSQSDFEKTVALVRSNPKLLYRVLARMIQDPKQPFSKLYNFGQTLFMHVGTQGKLHKKGLVKSPDTKEREFAQNLGAVKLKLPLGDYEDASSEEYIAFYAITNPRDPFSTDFESYIAGNEFVDKDFLTST